MNKNTLTAILMGFVICLGIVVVILSIKLSVRPKAAPEPELPPDNVVVDNVDPIGTPTPKDTPTPTPTPEIVKVVVQMVRTTDSVNIRSQATTQGNNVLHTASVNEEYVLLEELDSGWCKIEYEDGVAYIYSKYVKKFEKEVEVTAEPEE